MSDDIRIAACREAELPALMRFIGTHWRAGHILSRDETLLRWQFDPTLIKGRSLPGPSVMLAWHRDEIVGILGLIGFDLNVAGVPVAGAWLSHWFAVPEYRARNVATRLILAVRGLGLEVLGAVGANDVSKKALLAWGWELIPDLPRWIGVIDRPQTTALLSASGAAVAPEAAEELCQRRVAASAHHVRVRAHKKPATTLVGAGRFTRLRAEGSPAQGGPSPGRPWQSGVSADSSTNLSRCEHEGAPPLMARPGVCSVRSEMGPYSVSFGTSYWSFIPHAPAKALRTRCQLDLSSPSHHVKTRTR